MCDTSPSTVTFRVLEPGGEYDTSSQRGDIIQEKRGIRWPLLCHPQSSRVPHGKGKAWGGGLGRNSISRGGLGEKAGRANLQGPGSTQDWCLAHLKAHHRKIKPCSAMWGPHDLEQDLNSLNLFP